ncbi:hypothetical protein N665_0788s0013 [Sinapis alba]|nr:hypothetical protein N665_0788s0013 [Sinapis alba]
MEEAMEQLAESDIVSGRDKRSTRWRETKQAAESDRESSGEQQSKGGERWNKRR